MSEGAEYRYTMRAIDLGVIPGGPLVYGAPVLPPFLVFDGVATIAGTPEQAHVGTHSVVLMATDGAMTIEERFQILVVDVNAAPELRTPITPDPQRATVGASYRLEVGGFFTDPDGEPLAFSASGLPPSLALDAATGVVAGTPTAADAAVSPFNVTVQASDGEAAAADSFMLEVIVPDRPPVLSRRIEPDPQTAVEGEPYAFDAAPFFSDPDGDVLSFDAFGLPPSFAIDPATGRISGTPGNADVRTKPVTAYTVTVTAANGGGQASDAFRLEVHNVNQPPAIPDPPPRLSTDEDEPLTITAQALRATDPDGDALTVIVAPPSAGDRFTLGGGARITPAADYGGPLSVRVRVRDGEADSNAVTVAIDVRPVNDRPRGGPVPRQSATEAVPFELALAPLFSDVEGDALTFSARGLPPGLALDPATGAIAGTVPLGTPARDYRVELQVSDGEDRLDAPFTLAVLPAGRVDLAAEIAVAPNPVPLATPATWTLTVRNTAKAVDVGNVELTARFAAEAPFALDPPANAGCTAAADASGTEVRCRVGPLAAGASAAVTLTGTGARGGDVLGTLSVAVADLVPVDERPENDAAFTTLHVAEQLGGGAAQELALPDARAAAAGDFDGDGVPDLAVASPAGVHVFRGGPDPANAGRRLLLEPPTHVAQTPANGVAAADLDGDGDLDLAVAAAAGSANALLRNGGALTFTAVPLADRAVASHAVALGDLDGDGLPEAVFANDGAASVYANRGGVLERSAELLTAGSRDVALVNVVGDAAPEIVLANAAADAVVHARTGTSFSAVATLPTGPTSAVAAGDFDGSGTADLVFGRDGTGGAMPPSVANPVFLNTSTAAPSFFLTDELGAAPTLHVLAADIDLDGDDDVLTVNATGGHQLYVNGGAASAAFLLHPMQLAVPGARAAAAANVGIDERIDVVLAGGAALAVLFNDGRGNLGAGDVEPPALTLAGEPTVAVTVGETYADAGATATDAVDGDLTARIAVDDPVDTAVVGTYTVTYRVADSSGNAAPPVTRTVEVRARSDTGGGGGGGAGPGGVLLLLLWLLRSKRRSLMLLMRATFAVLLAAHAARAGASDLSYTFIDFKVLSHSPDATGVQASAPGQTVEVTARDGDGIAVGGGVLLPANLYVSGEFASSVVDVDAVVMSPLTVAQVDGEFDLVTSTIALGYERELGENFDVIAELSYDSTEYDFGSFAGESFDTDDSGIGARLGFRWNPTPPFELFASARYSAVADVSLDRRELDADTRINAGVRWYFFEDLGLGVDYESGDASTWTVSMRFSFGNLPW